MARMVPIERKQAPWHLRWFYRTMRKMLGKELTPAKIQMRLPGMVWGTIATEDRFTRMTPIRGFGRIS